MERLLILLTVSLIGSSALAQGLDSLRSIWKSSTAPDSLRFKAAYDLIWDGYLFSDPDSARVLTEELRVQARSSGSLRFVARSHDLDAAVAYVKGNMREALTIYEKALPLHKDANDLDGTADVLTNMASMRAFLGEQDSALALYDRGMRIHLQIRDTMSIANNLHAIGRIHMVRGDHATAMAHYEQSLRIQRLIGNKPGIMTSLFGMGTIHLMQEAYGDAQLYFQRALKAAREVGDEFSAAKLLIELGTCAESLGELEAAEKRYRESLDSRIRLGDALGIMHSLNKLGELLRGTGRLEDSERCYSASIAGADSVDHPFGLATALIGMGRVQLQLGRTNRALETGIRGDSIARALGDASLNQDASSLLYEVHKAQGRHDQALAAHERWLALSDSLKSEENQRAILEYEYASAYARKAATDSLARENTRLEREKMIAEQRARNQLLAAALTILLVVLVAIGLRFRSVARANRAIKTAQAELIASEKKREAAQVREQVARDIHDELGAELTKIGLLGREAARSLTEDAGQAAAHLRRLEALSREAVSSLRDVVQAMDSQEETATAFAERMRQQSLRILENTGIESDLRISHIGDDILISATVRHDLSLLMKEAVNNLVKHSRASRASIALHTTSANFIVQVRDNGCGLGPSASKGRGIKWMHQRATRLGAQLTIVSNERGTLVDLKGDWAHAEAHSPMRRP